MSKLSSFAQEVKDRYEKYNGLDIDVDAICDEVEEHGRTYGDYDITRKAIGKIEGISETAVKKCIRKAQDKMLRRLFILTETQRLTNLFGGLCEPEAIDDLVAMRLAELIESGQLGTHIKQTVL